MMKCQGIIGNRYFNIKAEHTFVNARKQKVPMLKTL